MASPPERHTDEPARGEPPEVRFLIRVGGYEVALIALAPDPAPSHPLVRLRFPGRQGEVVLTLAELDRLVDDLHRLQAYLQAERRDRLPQE
jgi:hypothetical protein